MIITSFLLLANLAGGGTPPQHLAYAPAPPPPVTVSFSDAAQPSTLLAAAGGIAWFADRAARGLVAWDSRAGVARTVALPDQGGAPGHPRPLLLAPFPGGLWLWDVAGERGFVWYDDSWRGPLKVAGKAASLTALADGSAVVNTPAHPAGSFAILDRSGALKARFGSPPAAQPPELAAYYDTWVLCAVENGFVAAGRFLPRLVHYRPDGTKVWERIPQESGLAALERLRVERLQRLAKDCTSGCIEAELVEFASLGQGFADGSFAVVFSRRARLDWFARDGQWRRAARLDLPASAVLDPVGVAVLGEELFLSVNGSLTRLQAGAAFGGRVVDPDLAPIGGAEVTLARGEVREFETRTGEDGTFAVPADFADLSAAVQVRAEGYLPWRRTGVVRELTAEEIVLEPEPVVCVRAVERGSGAPVRRFFLTVARLAEGVEAAEYRAGPPPTLVEDEEGRGCLPAQWAPPLQVRVCAEGFACTRRRLLTGGEVKVELDPEAHLEVRVRNGEGRPVAGAEVQVLAAAEARRRPRISDEAPALTDATGVATFAGRQEGDYLLEVSAQGFLPWQSLHRLEAGRNRREVTLEEGSEVAFAVKEDSGEPVVGARVWVQASQDPNQVSESRQCSTDEGGRCRVAALPSGPARVLVRVGDEREAAEHFHIPSPGEVQVTLPASGRLEGEVIGAHHYPGAELEIVAQQARYAASMLLDAAGHFSFHRLNVGHTLVEAVVHDPLAGGHWVLASERVEVGRERRHLRLQLPPPLRLEGRVTVAGGGCGACALIFTLESDPRTGWTASTAPDGTYQALLARPGSYLVRISDADTGRSAVRRLSVSGHQRWDVEVGGAILVGSVVAAATQEGVAAASVRVFDGGGQLVASAITSSAGTFRFTDLPAGEATVVAEANGAQGRRRVRLGSEAQQVVVELSWQGELLLHLVHGSSGAPVAGVVRGVVLPPAGAAWTFAHPLMPGEPLRLPAFGEGQHAVVVRPDRPLGRTTIHLAPRSEVTTAALWPPAVVEVLLPPGERGSLEVVRFDGRPVAIQDSYPFFMVEGNGMLVVTVPPGQYEVVVRGDRPAKAQRTAVALNPLQRVTITVGWQ